MGLPGDNTGDNISQKNPYFCELTVLYWLWKNDNSDIKGLFHYRRFLNLKTYDTKFYKFSKKFCSKYGLERNRIEELFNNYDIILPFSSHSNEGTVYKNYQKHHFSSDMDKTLDIIKDKYPYMYEEALRIFMRENSIYQANMIVAKRDLFNEYSDWLFSILFELEKQIQPEVLKREEYQKRVYGFLSERLTAIFINYKQKQGIKVANAPLLIEDPKFGRYINYKFNHLVRNKILMCFGIKKEKWEKRVCPK